MLVNTEYAEVCLFFTRDDFKLPGCSFKWPWASVYVNLAKSSLNQIFISKRHSAFIDDDVVLYSYYFDDVNVMKNVTSKYHNIHVIRHMHTRIKDAISQLLLGIFNSNKKKQIVRKWLNSLKLWKTKIRKQLPEGPKSHDAGIYEK